MSDQGKLPPQQQEPPGVESEMTPRPRSVDETYRGSGKLAGRVAIVTGGDSGIGRAVAVAFAEEGADVHVAYLEEHEDAAETRRLVEERGRRCLLTAGDVGEEPFCAQLVRRTVDELGRLDVLVNHAGEQHVTTEVLDVRAEQVERTFRTNVFSFFHLTRAALPHLAAGAAIINTTSVTAYRGSSHLLDYSASKGAIVTFTRSLAQMLAERGIRVNAVAPGAVWTPLIPSTFPPEKVEEFGRNNPMGRPAQPEEIAPSYVFLASDDSSFMTGQVLHPNGGEMVGG